eukprot:XP_025983802.1 PTI1-like tyrosine-protein kinase 2 [Glycine max]
MYTTIPDHNIQSTAQGMTQALRAEKHLRRVISSYGCSPDWRVQFYVSPYARTRSTLCKLRHCFLKKRIIGVREESRVREHDFENYQVEERMKYQAMLWMIRRGDTKDHPLTQWFLNFSEADELLKLAAARQQPSQLWTGQQGKKIALGAGRGLLYLHEQCDPKIIHRDVKAKNILLDDYCEAVVGDFGLAKLLDHMDSYVTTTVRGTVGAHSP